MSYERPTRKILNLSTALAPRSAPSAIQRLFGDQAPERLKRQQQFQDAYGKAPKTD